VYVKTRSALTAGNEITISYRPLCKKMSRSERIESLQNQYYFKCRCPACDDSTLIKSEDIVEDKMYEHPILTESFLCPSCNVESSPSPLVINSIHHLNHTNMTTTTSFEGKCLRCGITIPSAQVTPILEAIEAAKKVSNLCKALASFGRRSESERHLLKTLSSLNKVCFHTNRMLLTTHLELLSLYLGIDRLEDARKCCEDVNQIKKLTFGPDSFEYRQGALQLLNIRWIQQNKKEDSNRNTSSSMNRKIVQRLLQESSEAVDSGMQLLNKSKVRGGFVLLDNSLVSFLKELVQLERQLKPTS